MLDGVIENVGIEVHVSSVGETRTITTPSTG